MGTEKKENGRSKAAYFFAGVGIGALVVLVLVMLFQQNISQNMLFALPFMQTSQATVTPIFSPENGNGIIEFIKSANISMEMEMYTFSSEDVISAVISAKDRGVNVRIILEEDVVSATNKKTYDKLKAAGVDIRWASKKYALTHAKFTIIDGKLVLVGSHNLSKNALEKNREASAIISGPAVDEFEKVFETDWEMT